MQGPLSVVLVLLVYLVPAALGFLVLYFVIRGAVLSALRLHAAETRPAAVGVPPTHLDQDGL
jgi:hypothetical protein